MPPENILQSHSWALFQLALGRGVVERDGYLGIEMQERGVSYLYIPYGPTADRLANLVPTWRGSQYDFVRLEPMGEIGPDQLRQQGFVQSIELNPSHTSVVDLTLDESVLRSELSSGHRSAINSSSRRGISIEVSHDPGDVDQFLRLIHLTAGRRGFRPHSDQYYRQMLKTLMPTGNAKLYLARHQGNVVAAAIGLDYAKARYYAHAGADPAARQLQAAVPLVWQMMMDAKAAGMTTFDLWGVAPETVGERHPWAGFSQFKRAFGGQEVNYAGTWDLPLKPLKYQAYRVARRLNRLVKR